MHYLISKKKMGQTHKIVVSDINKYLPHGWTIIVQGTKTECEAKTNVPKYFLHK